MDPGGSQLEFTLMRYVVFVIKCDTLPGELSKEEFANKVACR